MNRFEMMRLAGEKITGSVVWHSATLWQDPLTGEEGLCLTRRSENGTVEWSVGGWGADAPVSADESIEELVGDWLGLHLPGQKAVLEGELSLEEALEEDLEGVSSWLFLDEVRESALRMARR